MRKNGYIFIAGLKPDVIIVFLDPDFLYGADISPIRPQIMVVLRIFHCACAKRPSFYFRSEIYKNYSHMEKVGVLRHSVVSVFKFFLL